MTDLIGDEKRYDTSSIAGPIPMMCLKHATGRDT